MEEPLQDAAGFWASGGEILGVTGVVQPAAAIDLLLRYGVEANRHHRLGERQAAGLCADVALGLARALLARDDWRCAAAGIARSQSEYSSLRKLMADLKFARYG